MISFAIKNRWTGSVMFTAEIDATDKTATSINLGLVVPVAVKANVYLCRANLSRANLRGADLSRANLSEADRLDLLRRDAGLIPRSPHAGGCGNHERMMG